MSSYHYAIIVAVLLALCFIGCARTPSVGGAGATEAWWTYIADYDGIPGTTTVDLIHARSAPVKGHGTLLVTGVDYVPDPQKDGLPTASELAEINKLRDSRTVLLCSRGAIEVGTFVSDKRERQYFYVSDAQELEASLNDLYQRDCPSRKPITKTTDDQKWSAYREFLLPNKATIEFHREELVRLGAIKYLE